MSAASGFQPQEVGDESRAMWSDEHSDEGKRENGTDPRGHLSGLRNEAGAGESLGQEREGAMRLSHAHHQQQQQQGGHGNLQHRFNDHGHEDVPEGARMKRNKPVKWSAEEDRRLRDAVEKFSEARWKDIANLVQTRNHVQCLQRWKKVLKPGLVKGQWSTDEDDRLVRLVERGFRNWGQVACFMDGRTSKQCRERWCHHLDPAVRKGGYTAEEDDLIIFLQGEVGNRWADIAKRLTGRTENAVKIRWKALNRRQRDARNRAAAAAAAAAMGAPPTGGSASKTSPPPQRTGAREGTRAHVRAATRAAATPSTALRGSAQEAAGMTAPAGATASTAQDSPSPAGAEGRHSPLPGDRVASVATVGSASPGSIGRGSAEPSPDSSFAAAVVRDQKDGEDRGLHRLCAALRNVEAMDNLQVAEDDATKNAAAAAAAERFRLRNAARFRRGPAASPNNPAPSDAEGRPAGEAVDITESALAVDAANTSNRPPPPSATPVEHSRPYSMAPNAPVQVTAGAMRDRPPALPYGARGDAGGLADAAPVVAVPVSEVLVAPVEPSPAKGSMSRRLPSGCVAEGGAGAGANDSSPTRYSSLVAVAERSGTAATASSSSSAAAVVVEESATPIAVSSKRSKEEKPEGTEVDAAAMSGERRSCAVAEPPAKKARSPTATLPFSRPPMALPVPNSLVGHAGD